MKLFSIFILCGCLVIGCKKQTSKKNLKKSIATPLTLSFKHIGIALQKKDTHVWGCSPVFDKDGKVHLYVAEWPKPKDLKEKFSGWFKHSRIGHYIGDSPEGPFKFVRIAVKDKNGKFNAPHNPTIRYIDNKYVLSFIVNENNEPSTQRIIMYVADDLNDDWRPVKGAEEDGTILRLPTDKNIWSHKSCRGITNPSLIKHKDTYYLYFKAVIPDPKNPKNFFGWNFGYGVATSKNLEGPYTYHPKRITPKELQLEDVAAFSYNNKVYMFSRDIRGTLGPKEGGIIWKSDNGFDFPRKDTEKSFSHLSNYTVKENIKGASVFRGTPKGQLERPQLLFKEGKPIYMYVATGLNKNKGYGSCSHVFKLEYDENKNSF